MPDFSRWGANGGDPSLNAIARTDRYLDALATEQQVYATDPADAELANLMAGWRDEVRRPQARGVATQRDAEVVLQRALSTRQRTRMSMAVVGSVAAALLCLGGFGAIVYGAGPGDALYGLRVAVFGEQRATRDDQVALAAQTEMQQVQQLIDQGNWDEAQDKLQTITSTVQTVEDPQRQEELQQQLNQLKVKVENRDPDATVPAVAPLEPIVPPNISLPPIQLPTELPSGVPPDISLPRLPQLPQLPLPGPDISLPQLPQLPLPGSVVPPDVSLPPIQLPRSVPAGPKPVPAEPKPPKSAPEPDEPNQPQQQEPPDNPKPAPRPAPEQPKPAEPPKQEVKPAPAPKAPPTLAPVQEEPPAAATTTIPPIPGAKAAEEGD